MQPHAPAPPTTRLHVGPPCAPRRAHASAPPTAAASRRPCRRRALLPTAIGARSAQIPPPPPRGGGRGPRARRPSGAPSLFLFRCNKAFGSAPRTAEGAGGRGEGPVLWRGNGRTRPGCRRRPPGARNHAPRRPAGGAPPARAPPICGRRAHADAPAPPPRRGGAPAARTAADRAGARPDRARARGAASRVRARPRAARARARPAPTPRALLVWPHSRFRSSPHARPRQALA